VARNTYRDPTADEALGHVSKGTVKTVQQEPIHDWMQRQAFPERATEATCIASLTRLYGANSAQVRSYRAAIAKSEMHSEMQRRVA
jgi:hypothetical protein